jgi:hypothetical protein
MIMRDAMLKQTGILARILTAIITVTLVPYGGNISALFHMSQEMQTIHPLPPDFVVLSIPGYDGMEYYQVARNIPLFFSPNSWTALAASAPGPNAYQRFLLPLTAYLLSCGNDALLPLVFLCINIFSLFLAFLLVLHWHERAWLPAFSLALCPAALIGLHFSLAEPLCLLLITAFLIRFLRKGEIDAMGSILLCFAVLTREVLFLFVVAFALLCILRKDWRSAVFCSPAIAAFLVLQAIIRSIFGQAPFFLSTAKRDFPLLTPVKLLMGEYGYNLQTLSSIALLILFVLPAVILVIRHIVRTREVQIIPALLLLFLIIMLSTPSFIWGSITSIGRVITPVYPLFTLFAAMQRNRYATMLCVSLTLLGITASLGLAFTIHPFFLS